MGRKALDWVVAGLAEAGRGGKVMFAAPTFESSTDDTEVGPSLRGSTRGRALHELGLFVGTHLVCVRSGVDVDEEF